MTQRTQEEQLAALRAPFDPADIGKLPRAKYKNTDPKGECTGHANDRGDGVTCGKYHTLPAIHLDYVGHGALTKRLLDVDPMWTWEPVAYDEAGLPLVSGDRKTAELWIRLTVAGVTRIGVGTAPADQHELAKVLIGDALRNAGMRFGVALDLWVKGDEQDHPADAAPPEPDGETQAKYRMLVHAGGDRMTAAAMWSKWTEHTTRGGQDQIDWNDPDTLTELDTWAAQPENQNPRREEEI